MTLTSRILLFFSGVLAGVLIGFSASVYWLISSHLYRHVDQCLEGSLDTLAASMELDAAGVEWEPDERRLNFGTGPFGEVVSWRVADRDGRPVAQGRGNEIEQSPAGSISLADSESPDRHGWRSFQRRIEAAPGVGRPTAVNGEHPAERRYSALIVSASLPLRSVHTALHRLAWTLTGVSLAIFGVVTLIGRTVCRRALRPLTRMAAAARSMDESDLKVRLPQSAVKDELAGFAAAFNELLDRLQEAFERERQFTAEASHQLRTPLTAILGQVDVALRRDRPEAEYRRVLEGVRRQGGHLNQIVESLLFLARRDGEAEVPARRSIDLRDWLSEHQSGWSDHPRAADLSFETVEAKAVWVETQPVLLKELLNNLVDNALKYSKPRTPVVVRLAVNEQEANLIVEDRGLGFDQDDIGRLFEPFQRSEQARREGIPGAGLGLAISQKLAAALGGVLEANSKPGDGSRFTVKLPVAVETPIVVSHCHERT